MRMELKKFREAEATGKVSIERFYGQTIFYIPEYIGDIVDSDTIWRIVREYFPEETLDGFSKETPKLNPRRWNLDILGEFFYSIEFPSVIIPPDEGPSRWHVADEIAEKILGEYHKRKLK